ncbi:hypothetical protein CHS0354_005435 [Potamilus streckersoni]|uniref:Uncharacterized protein n=1 Tax=Potamilus streckersoni TaxID=2493646 RepID=A0AAE0TII5_9BIVA|nr:hypothetical protein CHS0354_005435 [Potamilus streckersoni]
MPFSSGREEDGPEYLNALSSGREDKGRLWTGSPFSSRKHEYQMSTMLGKCPFQAAVRNKRLDMVKKSLSMPW